MGPTGLGDTGPTGAAGGSNNIITPVFTSATQAPDSDVTDPIVYTATSSTANVNFFVEDDDGTGVTIDYNTGVMTGGAAAGETVILSC